MEFRLTVLVCDFCGSVHATEEGAVENGCDKEPKPPTFKVGDTVTAKFNVGAGMEHVGTYYAKGCVMAVSKPNSGMPEFKLQHLDSCRGDQSMSFYRPENPHEWRYHVKPLEKHPDKGRYINEQIFLADQIQKHTSE